MALLDGTHYVECDVVFGAELAVNKNAVTTSDSNVGVSETRSTYAAAYSDQYVVSGVAPTPVIFDSRPTAGKRGDTVTVYGHGFGATEGEFSGQIQARKPNGVWEAQTAVTWARTAAAGDAYTSTRDFDLAADPPVIDTEHETITFLIPQWAVPLNMAIRVVTDGP